MTWRLIPLGSGAFQVAPMSFVAMLRGRCVPARKTLLSIAAAAGVSIEMGSTRVLVVDDARLMAELRSTLIGRSSFDVRAVRPGQDIVAHARNQQPDVILLRDGEACPDSLEVVRRLRVDPATREIPLIYIGLGLDRDRYREAGVSVFIPRPVTRLDLQEALRRVLEIRDRIALRRQVSLDLEIEIGDLVVRGHSVNLSLTGAFVVLDRRLAVGEQGAMRFQAGGRDFALPMEIVRSGPGHGARRGYGVRFRGIDSESAGYLARFVRAASDRRGTAIAPHAGGTRS